MLSFFNNVYAQDSTRFNDGNTGLQSSQNPTIPLGVALGVGYVSEVRDYVATISIDYLLTPKICGGVSYGNFLFDVRENIYSIGLKYWFKSKNYKGGFSPFIGLNYVRFRLLDGEIGEEVNTVRWEKDYFSIPEVTIGICHNTKFGLQTSLQLNYYFDDFYLTNIEFRLGWRFNLRKEKTVLH